MKSERSEHSNRSVHLEGGFVLIFYVLIVVSLLAYALITVNHARNNRERTSLNHIALNGLNAAVNAAPTELDMFLAACNSLKAQKFPSMPCNATDYTTLVSSIPADDTRVLTYNNVSASTGGTCSNISFTYVPARSLPPAAPPEFCIDASCDSSIPLLSRFSGITRTGTSSCVTGKLIAAYMGVDFSGSLHLIYMDNESIPGSDDHINAPPSFAVIGDDDHFGINFSVPDNSADFYLNDSRGPQFQTPQELIQHLVDLQIPGVRDAIDTDPSSATFGELLYPIRMPFDTKEFDATSNPLDAFTALTTIAPGVHNPDSVHPLVLQSLPDLVDWSSGASGPDGLPDPIQYIGPSPKLNSSRSERQMKRWLEALPRTTSYETWRDQHSYTRGGHLTQNDLSNQCFGVFLHLYKQAAEQILYVLGNYRIRSGVLAFTNWVYPILPLYPSEIYEDVASPLYNKAITDNAVRALGPPPGALPLLPGSPPNNDYILQQFGDIDKPVQRRMTRTAGAATLHAKSLCARWLSHTVRQGPPIPPATSNPQPFAALPNPYDSGMQIVDRTDPNAPVTSCASNTPIYNLPLIYPSNGRCYDDIDQSIYHSGSSVDICDLPDPFDGPGDPPSPLNPPIMNGMSTPNIPPIQFPYRWCNADSGNTSSRPNIAVALQSLASGGFSKTGYVRRFGTNWWSTGPLSDADFPYETAINNTATPYALLVMKRALEDPTLVGSNFEKFVILFTDGSPRNSVRELLDTSQGPRQQQSYFFPKPPTLSELPSYPGGDVPGVGNYRAATLETLHLLHSMRGDGFKVFFLFINNGLPDNQRDFLLAGLRSPNAEPGDDSGNPSKFNFCKPEGSGGGPVIDQLPGEANMPSGGQSCDPDGAYPPGFVVVNLTKGISETYDEFRVRVNQELARQVVFEIAKMSLTK